LFILRRDAAAATSKTQGQQRQRTAPNERASGSSHPPRLGTVGQVFGIRAKSFGLYLASIS
jgi:hypothetical protein